MYKKIGESCFVFYSTELEALLASLSLIMNNKDTRCIDVLSKECVESLSKKYSFLINTTEAVKSLSPNGILEFFRDYEIEKFTLEDFESYILSLGEEGFFRYQFPWLFKEQDLRKALNDEAFFYDLYSSIEDKCPNYLAIHTFFYQSRRYIKDIFALAKDLLNERFFSYVNSFQQSKEMAEYDLERELTETSALKVTETKLHKEIKNRGPYKRFIFCPSLFIPYRAYRCFVADEEISSSYCHQQVLFYSIDGIRVTREKTTDEIVKTLKTISDKTRYQIMKLLAEGNPVYGLDLVKKTGLAPSTISHHIDQLRMSGFVIEEPVKQSKYYTINKEFISNFLEQISKDFNVGEV